MLKSAIFICKIRKFYIENPQTILPLVYSQEECVQQYKAALMAQFDNPDIDQNRQHRWSLLWPILIFPISLVWRVQPMSNFGCRQLNFDGGWKGYIYP